MPYLPKGRGGQSSFEYCWSESKSGMPSTPARPIPGHHRAKTDKSGYKSPRSPKSPKSPKSLAGSGPLKSPGGASSGGKSPYSDLIAMSDASLAEFKAGLIGDKRRFVLKIIKGSMIWLLLSLIWVAIPPVFYWSVRLIS